MRPMLCLRTAFCVFAIGAIMQVEADDEKPSLGFDQIYTVLENSGRVTLSTSMTGPARTALMRQPAHAEEFVLRDDGTFDYKPKTGFHGQDDFLFVAGVDRQHPIQVTLTVLWVNNPPSFKPGGDQVCDQDAGQQVARRWAAEISAGAADEDRYQKLSWAITNDNPQLFSEQPQLSRNGDLQYTPALGATGTARVIAWLRDDGGSLNGGSDASAPAQFTIRVTPIERAPSLEPIPEQTLAEGSKLDFQVRGSTQELGRLLVYQLFNAPEGMNVEPLSGRITWVPSREQVGNTFSMTVRVVASGTGLSDQQTMIVKIVRRPGAQTSAEPIRRQSRPTVLAPGVADGLLSGHAATRITGLERAPPAEPARHRFWVE